MCVCMLSDSQILSLDCSLLFMQENLAVYFVLSETTNI